MYLDELRAYKLGTNYTKRGNAVHWACDNLSNGQIKSNFPNISSNNSKPKFTPTSS